MPLRLTVDASQAPQRIFHVSVVMAAKPGAMTIVYPKWIPGWHGPVGPVADVVNLRLKAGATPLEWRRDLVDFYAIHTIVPSGAESLEADFDLVSAPPTAAAMDVPVTANLAIVQWSSYVFYPEGASTDALPVQATLVLPNGWDFGTALPVASQNGARVTFAPVSLTTLVDSPLNTGRYAKKFQLDDRSELDIAADSAAALDAPDSFLTGMRHLVAEGPAIYGGVRHYRRYHFLLTLSDAVAPNGIEHHESSDNRAPEKYLTDPQAFEAFSDLMPHEYSHSWNGKYRRPADLLVDDFQKPERTDLLWVYEGLNQYVGEVLTARSRLDSLPQQLDWLASHAARMSVENGRAWRPIRDVADEAPLAYNTPGAFYALRRSAGDFYTEGSLIWLDADVTIRRLSAGKKSLDDFLALWAAGGGTTPSVLVYDQSDVERLLGAVAPYDWARFFATRIASVQPRAPLAGIEKGGWRLTYSSTQSEVEKAIESSEKTADFRYSLGFTVSTEDGTLKDVRTDSPAFAAGLAPAMKVVAVNGRKFSVDALRDALKSAKVNRTPLELIASNGDFFKIARVEWFEGERYPHLVREPALPDLLTRIYAPRTFVPPKEAPQKPT